MSRYFFHVRDGAALLLDEEGEELPDLKSAHAHAVESAREVLSEAALSGKAASLKLKIEVADGAGRTIMVVPVGQATGTETQR